MIWFRLHNLFFCLANSSKFAVWSSTMFEIFSSKSDSVVWRSKNEGDCFTFLIAVSTLMKLRHPLCKSAFIHLMQHGSSCSLQKQTHRSLWSSQISLISWTLSGTFRTFSIKIVFSLVHMQHHDVFYILYNIPCHIPDNTE